MFCDDYLYGCALDFVQVHTVAELGLCVLARRIQSATDLRACKQGELSQTCY